MAPIGAVSPAQTSNVSPSTVEWMFSKVIPVTGEASEAPIRFVPVTLTVVQEPRTTEPTDAVVTVEVCATPVSRVIRRMLPTASY